MIKDITRTIILVMIGVLLSLAIVILSSDQPSRSDLQEQLQGIERQVAFNSCLLLIEPEDRVPEAVAECQGLDPDSVSPTTTP